MHNNPSWQPHFCLHMIREIIVQLYTIPDGKGLRIDDSNKVHGQLFRCLDNTLKDLNTLIGNCVRVRASAGGNGGELGRDARRQAAAADGSDGGGVGRDARRDAAAAAGGDGGGVGRDAPREAAAATEAAVAPAETGAAPAEAAGAQRKDPRIVIPRVLSDYPGFPVNLGQFESAIAYGQAVILYWHEHRKNKRKQKEKAKKEEDRAKKEAERQRVASLNKKVVG